MVPLSDFSGLVSSPCALASAAAIAPIVSLDRCIGASVDLHEFEAHGAGFRSLGANAVPKRLLGVLRHEPLEFGFGFFVLEKGLAGAAENRRELGPRVRTAHIDDADRCEPRSCRVDAEEPRGLARLNAAPKLPLRCDEE